VDASVTHGLSGKLRIRVPRPALEWLLATGQIARVAEAASRSPDAGFFAAALRELDIHYTCSDADLCRIPATGPALIVANHPFGMLEGLILGAMLDQIRPDYRFVANSLLQAIPNVANRIIPVDPFGGAVRGNAQALRQAQRWLSDGGLLLTFPAGEVSNLHGMPPVVADGEWNTRLIRLARQASAPIVPVFFFGHNGMTFQLSGLVHPSLRTALLCRELLNKRGGRFRVAVGNPFRPDPAAPQTDRDLTEYVREKTYALGYRERHVSVQNRARARLAEAQSSDVLDREIAALRPDALVFEKGDYRGYVVGACEIPRVLNEIGRLREIAFRAAGEGSGKALDLDRFDQHYRHLFLWKPSAREIVGGYRLAEVDRVLDEHGADGLYTHTLFRFERGFLERLRTGLELGRSFIRPEYQRSVHALHYLWKSIGAYLRRSPRRYLFGPVSISEEYGEAARELIVRWFEERLSHRVVRPRCRFRRRNLRHLPALAKRAKTFADLGELIGDLDGSGRDLPVLLRQYLNLGGEVLGFNVDREFSNALDGLLLLDLAKATPAISRYLGE
jgi:putative hemolysin